MRKKDSTTLVVIRLIAEGASIDPRRNIYIYATIRPRGSRESKVYRRFVASEALRETDPGKPNLVNLSIYTGYSCGVLSTTRLERGGLYDAVTAICPRRYSILGSILKRKPSIFKV